MPSDLHVIAVRVPEERYQAIKRISSVSGRSMSGWINELIELALPMMDKALFAAIQGEAAQEQFLKDLRTSAQLALDEVEALDRARGAGHGDTRTGERPPLSNRGVTRGR